MTTATKRRPPVADARKKRVRRKEKPTASKKASTSTNDNGNPPVVSDSLIDKMAGEFLCANGKKVHPHFSRRMARVDEKTQEEVYLKLVKLGLKDKVLEFKAKWTTKDEDETDVEPVMSVANGESSRIFWTEAEWDALAQTLWAMRLKDPFSPLSKFFPKAQEEVIEEGRRRSTIGVLPEALTSRLMALQKESMGQPIEQRKKEREALLQEHSDTIELMKMEMEEEKMGMKEELGKRPNRDKVIEDLTEQDLQKLTPRLIQATTLERFLSFFSPEEVLGCYTAAQLLPAVAQVLATSISQFSKQVGVVANALESGGFARQPQQQQSAKATDKSPLVERLTKICIVGPRDKDMSGLRDHFKGTYDLIFIKKDQRISQDMFPTNCGLIVMWTNFVNHGHCHMAKAHGRKNGIPVREWQVGSWRAMATKIEEFNALLDADAA